MSKIIFFLSVVLCQVFSVCSYSQSNKESLLNYEVCSECDGKGKLAPSERMGFKGKGVEPFAYINVSCTFCKNWDNWQKTVAKCPKCQNNGSYLTTRKVIASDYVKCTACNGTGGFKSRTSKLVRSSNIKILSTETNKKNFRENRVALYLALVDAKIITKELYPDWVDFHFNSENNVSNLYNFLLRNQLFIGNLDEKSFFKNFACDVSNDCSFCINTIQLSTENNTPISNNSQINETFSCLINCEILKGVSRTFNGLESVTYKLSTGGELQFYKNKSFIYISRNDPNRKIKGKWECNGLNDFIANTENNARLDSKKGYWEYDVPNKK